METIVSRAVIVLYLSLQISFAAFSDSKHPEERIEVIQKIIARNVLKSGVDIKKIHEEVSRQFPLDPVKSQEYLELIKKRDAEVERRFQMSDRQLRKLMRDRAERLYPLYNLGDDISITYLLHGKPFKVRGKFYRKSATFLFIGSNKVAIRNIPAEIRHRFDVEQTQKLRKKYILDRTASYHRERRYYAAALLKDEILRSQGYLHFNNQWVSCRDFIQLELKRIAANKGVSLEKLIKGIPSKRDDDLPPPKIELDPTGRTLIRYPREAPNKSFKIPNSVSTIAERAFSGCKNLESVDFPSGLLNIGSNAFSFSGLKKVILPNGINEIGSAAFSYCANLEEISFPENLTVLKWAVCANCDKLRKVSVSPRLRQIEGRAFWECRKLAEINIPETIVSIEKGAFYGVPVAAEIERFKTESFKIPGVPLVPFNWKFTLDDYHAQGFNVKFLGTAANVQEYEIANRFNSFICLKHTHKANPFCFVFSGRIARLATIEIANALKDPDKKYHYLRTKSFDADTFDRGLSEHMGVVFLAPKFKLLLQFDRKDHPQMAIYRLDDGQDETYYRMLHYKTER